MKIHKEGRFVILLAILAWLTINVIVILTSQGILKHIIFLITTVILIIILRFFRVPKRYISPKPTCVLAPADGTIVAIEETRESEYFNDHRVQVSVFMSIFNVHINWIPVPGIIRYFKHHNGRFIAAYLPKSSSDNERATTVIQIADGTEILVRQIAGAIAKRISTYVIVGKRVSQHEELGFIRFGSRVDVFLPIDSEIQVELHQKVKGGQSILAELPVKSIKE